MVKARHKRRCTDITSAVPRAHAAAASSEQAPELLRRVLLGLVTALVVARPLVAGEDPGRLLPLAGVADQVLATLWLLAGLGWAGWWAWTRKGEWYGGLLEGGLLAAVLLVVIGAGNVAKYQHPAWLIASEWAVLLVAVFLVRQLASRPADARGLLSAVLATGVTLSAYALYQRAVEIPRQQSAYEADPNAFLAALPRLYLPMEPESPLPAPSAVGAQVSATFSSSSAFAGYLALLFPALVGAVVVCWQLKRWSAHALCLGGFVVLMGVALLLAQGWSALLALILVGGGAAVLSWRRLAGTARLWMLGGLVALGAVAVLSLPLGLRAPSSWLPALQEQFEQWGRTWAMIRDHVWLGVGPGNFSREYPRYLTSAAFAKLAEPGNFVLELWATGGLLTLLAVLFALGAFFRGTWPALRVQPLAAPEQDAPGADEDPEPAAQPRISWEFYLGGVTGLIVAFMLWAVKLPSSEILNAGLVAAARSLVWFLAFALLEAVPWSGPAAARALTAGVAALLLYLLVCSSIVFPTVAQPLWIAAALALTFLAPQPVSWPGKHWIAILAPLPVMAAACLGYGLLVCYPTIAAVNARDRVHRHVQAWRRVAEPLLVEKLNETTDLGKRVDMVERYIKYMDKNIIRPMHQAVIEDPYDSSLHVELAHWYAKRGEVYARTWEQATEAERQEPIYGEAVKRTVMISVQSIERPSDRDESRPGQTQLAQILDPDGPDSYLAEYRIRLMFADLWARVVKQLPKTADDYEPRTKRQYQEATAAIHKLLERDPTEARLYYLLGEVSLRTGDYKGCRDAARVADKLDQQARSPERQLTDDERNLVKDWLVLPVR